MRLWNVVLEMYQSKVEDEGLQLSCTCLPMVVALAIVESSGTEAADSNPHQQQMIMMMIAAMENSIVYILSVHCMKQKSKNVRAKQDFLRKEKRYDR